VAKLNIVYNSHKGEAVPHIMTKFSKETADKVLGFHQGFEGYAVTPLVCLEDTAKELGTAAVYIKDESYRFSLNAFKGLGGSFCLGKYISSVYGGEKLLSYNDLISPQVKNAVGDITFVTATDGNHGRGIAWTASKLGQKSVVYMPKGSAAERLENIRKAGAMAEITDMNYDDTVRFARKQAQENGLIDEVGTLEDAVSGMMAEYDLHGCKENELIYESDDLWGSLFAKTAEKKTAGESGKGDIAALVELMENQGQMPVMYMPAY
jgi:hypothetical protein